VSGSTQRVRSGAGGEIGFETLGQGPDLVLLHGTLTDRTTWAPLLPYLAGAFRVIAVDRRGRGLSATVPGPVLEAEVADLTALIEALPSPPAVCAWSYGAVLALEAALTGVPVSKLVLYEPPLSAAQQVVPPGLVERYASLLAAGNTEGAVEAFLVEALELPPQFIEAVRGSPAWPVALATAESAHADLVAVESYRYDRARVAGCRVPALVLAGSLSPLRMRSAAEHLAADLPNGRLHVLEHHHHFAFVVDPPGFASVLTGFI
jgi:pimeloyl-ACP methyl ester carboxylesterase